MKIRVLPPSVALLLALLPAGLSAQKATPTAEPRFERAVSSDSASTREEKTVFRPDTPKIYILYRIADAAQGTRLRAVWYAGKVEGFAANAKLADQSSQTGAGSRFMGGFSCNKPPQGWWPGLYRVELSINDKPAKIVGFRVEAGTP
jgi:hypothetical protein